MNVYKTEWPRSYVIYIDRDTLSSKTSILLLEQLVPASEYLLYA